MYVAKNGALCGMSGMKTNVAAGTAEPSDPLNNQCKLAASRVRRLVSRHFSDAEMLRSDFSYLSDRLTQKLHMQFGVVMPALLVRYPHKYVFSFSLDSTV